MIYTVTMYAAKCDNCGKGWIDDHFDWCALNDRHGLRGMLDEADWHTERVKIGEDQHYCPECWSFDDDDNIVLSETRRNKCITDFE